MEIVSLMSTTIVLGAGYEKDRCVKVVSQSTRSEMIVLKFCYK